MGHTLAGRLLIFDALEMSWREVALRRNPACPVCGDEPTQRSLIDYELFCGVQPEDVSGVGSGRVVPEIDAATLAERLAADAPPFLVDVREPWEWAVGSLAKHGARLIPLGELAERLGEIPRDRQVVVYCRSGQRSLVGARAIAESGRGPVASLRGGVVAWAEAVEPGFPVV